LVIIIVGAGLTITYRVRLFYHSFQRKNLLRGILNREDYSRVYFPVGVLFFMMLFRGGGLSWSFFPIGFIFLPCFIKLLILLIILSLIIYLYYYYRPFFYSKIRFLIFFFIFMWGLVFLRGVYFRRWVKIGRGLIKWVDQGWGEVLGGHGRFYLIRRLRYWMDFVSVSLFKYYLVIFSLLIYLFFVW